MKVKWVWPKDAPAKYIFSALFREQDRKKISSTFFGLKSLSTPSSCPLRFYNTATFEIHF